MKKKIFLYAGILVGLLVLSYAYVPQVLSGKIVNQSDISGWQGTFVEPEHGNHGAGGKIAVMKRRAFPPQRPAFRLLPDIRRVERKPEITSEFAFDDPGGFHSLQAAMIQIHRFSSFARYSSKNCISA